MMHNDDDRTQTHVVLTKGTMVSHYRIVEKIGAGGMGEVYLAEDTQLDRKVALKFLPPHLCQDEDCRTRFKREAQAAAKLSHPNIVTIHEVGEHQNGRYTMLRAKNWILIVLLALPSNSAMVSRPHMWPVSPTVTSNHQT